MARWREAEVVRAAEVAAAEQQLAAAEVRACAFSLYCTNERLTNARG